MSEQLVALYSTQRNVTLLLHFIKHVPLWGIQGRTCTHTFTHLLIHTCSFILLLIHPINLTQSHTHTHTHSVTYTCTLSHTHTHTQSHTHVHSVTHTHTLSHIHMYTHTHTHTHTHSTHVYCLSIVQSFSYNSSAAFTIAWY